MCDMVMSRSHRTEGATAEVFQALQEPCFLWEIGAFVGVALHAQELLPCKPRNSK